jgi:hypothetical protein
MKKYEAEALRTCSLHRFSRFHTVGKTTKQNKDEQRAYAVFQASPLRCAKNHPLTCAARPLGTFDVLCTQRTAVQRPKT